jgi:hypothetical protein
MLQIEKTERKQKDPSQVITCRISKQQWHRFEIKCLEKRVPMSKIIRQAVEGYLKN